MSTTTDSTPEVQSPRLKLRYREEIVPALREQFEYANVMQVPGLTKIVVNMGVGEAARDSKLIEGAVRDLTAITGQKPQVTKRLPDGSTYTAQRSVRVASKSGEEI